MGVGVYGCERSASRQQVNASPNTQGIHLLVPAQALLGCVNNPCCRQCPFFVQAAAAAAAARVDSPNRQPASAPVPLSPPPRDLTRFLLSRSIWSYSSSADCS